MLRSDVIVVVAAVRRNLHFVFVTAGTLAGIAIAMAAVVHMITDGSPPLSGSLDQYDRMQSMNPKHCAECEQIVAEMRAAFLKLISARPRGDVLYISRLFFSEADLARLKELWQQSGFGAAPHKWMEHRIARGHVPVLLSAVN